MRTAWVSLALLCASSAFAGEALRGVEQFATIEDGEGHGRALFKWDAPYLGENIAIWKAMLRVDVSGESEARVLPIVIHPVTRPWSPETVDWESGWSRPGGDYDEKRFARAEIGLERGAGSLSVDMTALAKEILEAGYVCHGFLVTVDRSEGIGFGVSDLARLAGLEEAHVEVFYRTIPPVSRTLARSR